MRWCSRSDPRAGPGSESFALCGSEAGGAAVISKVELHAISGSASAATAMRLRARRARAPASAVACDAIMVTGVSALRNLDLLRPAHFNTWTVTLFHPSTDAHTKILKVARVQPGGNQVAL